MTSVDAIACILSVMACTIMIVAYIIISKVQKLIDVNIRNMQKILDVLDVLEQKH